MSLAWKVMIPLTLLNLVCVMIVKQYDLTPWLLLPASFALLIGAALIAGNWPQSPGREIVVTRGHERLRAVVR